MSKKSIVDLRSDTLTLPTAGMRRAMAEAEVGDDLYGEDPSVRRLEEEVAELLGMEAALFVPSGTMANQLALKLLTQPGDSVLVGERAHNHLFEAGAAGLISGLTMIALPGDGRFNAEQLRTAYQPERAYTAPTTAVSVENTHNMGGGLVWEVEALREVLAAAAELGICAHLDGARLWNAALASGLPERELAAGFTTASVCLSKGLGAPVGSVLALPRAMVPRAQRMRRAFGGAMRQSGVLAAAGSYALRHHRGRLGEDHAHARLLAEGLAELPGVLLDPASVRTNVVMLSLSEEAPETEALVAQLAEEGVLSHAMGPRQIRLVTHLGVDREGCGRAVEIFASALESALESPLQSPLESPLKSP